MYTGVKELISEFKESFDRIGKATKMAKTNITNRGEKADKETLKSEIDNILAEWDSKRDNGIKLHEKEVAAEKKNNPKCIYEGYNSGKSDGMIDPSLNQLGNNNTYLEKLLFSNKHGIIGYADKVVVKRGTIDITDTKVVSHIYRSSSFMLDNGFKVPPKKMSHPLEHLDDCNYNEFVLQLSLYMYMAWDANKNLKVGKLYINHIHTNDKGKIIDRKLIEVPYMRDEVKKMLKYKKLNES
jgi:hypothetical protein